VIQSTAGASVPRQIEKSDVDRMTDSLIEGIARLAAERDFWRDQAKARAEKEQGL
jgi:hypothetical protein